MALPATTCSTYPVLSTPHFLSETLLTYLFPFAEANQSTDELIQLIKNKTNVLNTSAFVDPVTSTKSPKLAISINRGKPLAMALYKPKRNRVARVPTKVESIRRKSRKLPTVPVPRDAKEKFVPPMTTPYPSPTEVSSMETTRTPSTTSLSEQLKPMVTELFVVASAPTEIVFEVDSLYFNELTFSMFTPDKLALLIYSFLLSLNVVKTNYFFLIVCYSFTHTITNISFYFSNITSKIHACHSHNLTPWSFQHSIFSALIELNSFFDYYYK